MKKNILIFFNKKIVKIIELTEKYIENICKAFHNKFLYLYICKELLSEIFNNEFKINNYVYKKKKKNKGSKDFFHNILQKILFIERKDEE